MALPTSTVTGRSFYYATGTSYLLNLFGVSFQTIGAGAGNTMFIPGTSASPGGGANWDGEPRNDPFPFMLDPKLWDPVRIDYPASTLGMNLSVATGVNNVVAAIKSRPGPFALGGYSQGAMVMSDVVTKELVSTSGRLHSRLGDCLGCVTFGNPFRQVNSVYPSGTWSGSWDVPGSTTGGHGAFPDSLRMTSTPSWFWNFVNKDEIITSVGDSQDGLYESAAAAFITGYGNFLTNGAFFSSIPAEILTLLGNLIGGTIGTFLTNTFDHNTANQVLTQVGAIAGNQTVNVVAGVKLNGQPVNKLTLSGGGHTQYPVTPPPGDPGNGLSSYQIALNYLNGLASGQIYSRSTAVIPTKSSVPINIRGASHAAKVGRAGLK